MLRTTARTHSVTWLPLSSNACTYCCTQVIWNWLRRKIRASGEVGFSCPQSPLQLPKSRANRSTVASAQCSSRRIADMLCGHPTQYHSPRRSRSDTRPKTHCASMAANSASNAYASAGSPANPFMRKPHSSRLPGSFSDTTMATR